MLYDSKIGEVLGEAFAKVVEIAKVSEAKNIVANKATKFMPMKNAVDELGDPVSFKVLSEDEAILVAYTCLLEKELQNDTDYIKLLQLSCLQKIRNTWLSMSVPYDDKAYGITIVRDSNEQPALFVFGKQKLEVEIAAIHIIGGLNSCSSCD